MREIRRGASKLPAHMPPMNVLSNTPNAIDDEPILAVRPHARPELLARRQERALALGSGLHQELGLLVGVSAHLAFIGVAERRVRSDHEESKTPDDDALWASSVQRHSFFGLFTPRSSMV